MVVTLPKTWQPSHAGETRLDHRLFDGLGEMYESIRKPLKFDKSLERMKFLRKYRDIHGLIPF